MAYAAVISLNSTISSLLDSSRISIVSPSRETLEFSLCGVSHLIEVLERLDKSRNRSERLKALQRQIRDAAFKLEDVLEFHVSSQLLSQSESLAGDEERCLSTLFVDLGVVRQHIYRFIQMAMGEAYLKELHNPLPEEEEEEEEEASSSIIYFGGNKSEMVGLSDQFDEIRGFILGKQYFNGISIVGMAGIGKTTLAKKIFEDPLILENFECRVFVRIGQKYQLNKILKAILAQVSPCSDTTFMVGNNEKLYEFIHKKLKKYSYLIVLDDVWSRDFLDDFKKRLPKMSARCQILVTTRLRELDTSLCIDENYEMRFLNKEESWDLLRENVFDEEVFPFNPQLEKAGQKIAENCEGLPLLVVTVADLLSKAERTPECWEKVAAHKENPIFVTAYTQISKVLYPSYNYLPQHLKACFLYMGTFPQNCDVRHSKLINLWSAEGFLDLYSDCLEDLVSNNLVLVHQESCYSGRVLTCSLHSVYWHLCKREAGNDKLLHILNNRVDCLAESMGSTRRFSIYKNILFAIKDVYKSLTSVSTVRSLLCTGPYHQYQVPICSDLRLLRVLDALTIRLYEFPVEVLKLVQLRYLAITYNGILPPSISKLWNLQYLIVQQHLSIISAVVESYLPVEIWDLQELKYLQIMGRNLPDPPPNIVLWKLSTLLDVGAHSCTRRVLKSIPNLKKLRVQIELGPGVTEPLSCFDNFSYLNKLKSLNCVILNPTLRFEIVTPSPPISSFTFLLKKLTLSGFGYSWKDMDEIAKLPYLEVLKLQCYAFRGEKWEAKKKGFLRLHYLLLEDTDIVQWTVGDESFPCLWYLVMKNCYKLQEIPNISSLVKIEVIDCNPLAVTCAEQMRNPYHEIHAYSSWNVRNVKS